MAIIGIDIDGVLANFTDSYAELFRKKFGLEFPKASSTWPTVWDWERAGGATEEQYKEVWKDITASHTFWRDLETQPDAFKFLVDISCSHHDLYFITARAGKSAKFQTERWLRKNGFNLGFPTVLISSEKGLCSKALRLDFYIDDRDENIADAAENGHGRVWRLERPYNHPHEYALSGDLSGFAKLISNV